jgi:hypothetical protein
MKTMVEQPFQHPNTIIGTMGGLLLVLLFKINNEDLVASAILAATGATVSFLVSVLLRWLWKQVR